MGGDCLNTGCVPSKALIASARLARSMRRAARLGLGEVAFDVPFGSVMDRVRERRARIAPHDSQERFESLGVTVLRGHARFRSPHEVEVDGRVLRARAFVIATGSRAGLPPIPGLAEARPFTNETIFDELRERPARLVVVGGGPIGCELGQAFAALGVRVTILEAGPRILDKEDEDAAAVVRRSLEEDGVEVRTGARIVSVRRDGPVTTLEVEGAAAVQAEAVLVAAGRIPNVEDLGLEQAGVAWTKRGVTVDDHLRTSQAHIYAAGDVAGSYQFTHLADHHARVVVRNILVPGGRAKVDVRVLPWCTYTSPELARVGLSEAEARQRDLAVDVWRVGMEAVDRAIVESEEDGFAKVLTTRGTDRIVGATIVGAHAGDLIHEIALAMKTETGLGTLSATIHAYPTWAEVARKLGDQQQRTRLTPLARRVFGWLYRARRPS
jgi:pyruvate/2-oxoglutarate dehydrogenase complex dihydrolipoamide dehydrogenase (E3) component